MLVGRRYRLELEPEQIAFAERVGAICRVVWNAALDQRRVAAQLNRGRTEDRRVWPSFASVFQQVKACSLGEWSRLQLARLVLQGCNLLLLDEPLNHLDVESGEHFEAALEAVEGTVIVVAHDRTFLRKFARTMLEVRAGRTRKALRPGST